MTIKVGEKIPNIRLKALINDQISEIDLADLLANKKTALFAVPGAFTGTCSNDHLPSYVEQFDSLKNKGIEQVICLSVNDIFVLKGWADVHKATKLVFIADFAAELTKTMGFDIDLSAFGMGVRSKRYAMLIDNGIVTKINIEENPGSCTVSKADTLVSTL